MLLALILFAIIISQTKERKETIRGLNNIKDFENFFKDSDICDTFEKLFGETIEDIGDIAKGVQNSSYGFQEDKLNKVASAALAKIAICYYVARADGSVSREEQLLLDNSLSEVLNSNDIPKAFRDEINAIANDSSNSFLNVEKYLNKVNPDILVSFLEDAKGIANADRKISFEEQESIKVFEKYLAGKTGRSYSTDVKEISTICEGCGAKMEFAPADSKIICPYCGQVKVISL